MSQEETIAVARRSFELYTESVAAARTTWAEQCVWHDPPEFPDAAVYEGAEAVAQRLEELRAVLPLDGLDIEEAIPVAEDEVLLMLGFRATGGGSGAPIDEQMACFVRVADGKIDRWRPFLDQGEARKEAGLG